MLQPKEYVEAEKQYFPEEWDELTKGQVAFMIAEAFQAGVNNGWTEGEKERSGNGRHENKRRRRCYRGRKIIGHMYKTSDFVREYGETVMFIELTDENGEKMLVRKSEIIAIKHEDKYTAVYVIGFCFKVMEDYQTVSSVVRFPGCGVTYENY